MAAFQKSDDITRTEAHHLIGSLLLEAIQEDREAAGTFEEAFNERAASSDNQEAEDDGLALALSYALVSSSVREPGETIRRQPSPGFDAKVRDAITDISPGAALTFLREAARQGVSHSEKSALRDQIKEALRNWARMSTNEKKR